jgi:hypothetical protein
MSDKPFVDYCPSLKPDDIRYSSAQKLLLQDNCQTANQTLTDCLQTNRKNFSKCQKESL